MNKERLLHLADLLDAHHDNGVRFDLLDWHYRNAREQEWCGTKACAVGLACLDPKFNAEGLKLDGSAPYFKHQSGWWAVKTFFDLGEGEDKHLFWHRAYKETPKGDAGAKEVANRIRQVVSGGFPAQAELEDISNLFYR